MSNFLSTELAEPVYGLESIKVKKAINCDMPVLSDSLKRWSYESQKYLLMQGRFHYYSILMSIYHECQDEGWDGYDALPINNVVIYKALKLLDTIIITLWADRLPINNIRISPGADNSITFEWHLDNKKKILSMAVDSDNKIIWGYIIYGDEASGLIQLDTSRQSLLYLFRRFYECEC